MDYTIVGAGPAGLTLAWYLAKNNKTVLILESEDTIGGNHGVRRVNNGMFTEHGPRVYLGNYTNFIELLQDMGADFDSIFIKRQGGISDDISRVINTLTAKEYLAFIVVYTKYFLSLDDFKKTSVLEFMNENDFSQESRELLDSICRKTDGADSSKYTLHEFLELANQNLFYNLYDPRKPNDKLLFPIWEKKLLETGNVTIIYNSKVKGYNANGKELLLENGTRVFGDKYILAIPPVKIAEIMDLGAQFGAWAKASDYLTYIPITFHWASKVNCDHGYIGSDWGIIWAILSDNTDFEDERSTTVVSISVTLLNQKSSFTGKTANETANTQNVLTEVFRQLNEQCDGILSSPDYSFMHSGMSRSNQNTWINNNTSFVLTKAGYSPIDQVNDNIYLLGSQNGNSDYSFISLESTVANSIHLLHELEPETRETVHLSRGVTVFYVLRVIIITSVLLAIYAKQRKEVK